MADDSTPDVPVPPRRRGKGLVIGLLGGAILGGAGFGVILSGLVPLPGDSPAPVPAARAMAPGVSFVEIEPMVVTLGDRAATRHLRFAAWIEVDPADAPAVAALMPRVRDVLNTYLRAVAESDLADPGATDRLRTQMLRRVQAVLGEARVRDLLISEFILG